jgi:hypothetical protein
VERVLVDEIWTRPPEAAGDWPSPEPGGITAQSAEHEVARRISSFARQMLLGMGGDPLFAAPGEWSPGAASWRHRGRSVARALRAGRLPRLGMRTALRRRHGRPPALPDWIEPRFARRMDLESRRRRHHAEWDGACGRRAMLHPYWPDVLARSHPGVHGLPAKALLPFFDLRLVEHVWEAPPHPWRVEKLLLRNAMRDRLPEEVLRRPKTLLYSRAQPAEGSPAHRLAAMPETRRWRRRLISDVPMGEYVDLDRVRSLIDNPLSTETGPLLGNCFALAHWLKTGFANPERSSSEESRHAADPTG